MPSDGVLLCCVRVVCVALMLGSDQKNLPAKVIWFWAYRLLGDYSPQESPDDDGHGAFLFWGVLWDSQPLERIFLFRTDSVQNTEFSMYSVRNPPFFDCF